MATDLVEVKDVNGCQQKPLNAIDTEKVGNETDAEEYSETTSLLSPRTRRGGTARKYDNTRRKVQWNDRNGNKLAEVLVFEPSEVSDSEDEDSDSCICTIM